MLADAARGSDKHHLPLTVIKLGGSLLTFPELPHRLDTLLKSLPGRVLLVIGGGITVDILRLWDGWFSLGEEFCHELAIRHLSRTADRVQQQLPHSRMVESPDAAADCWQAKGIPLLHLDRWLRTPEAVVELVPRSWDVTSDSLAAWVAKRWQADCLLLLKSTDLPVSLGVTEASHEELVDRAFPRFASGLPRVSWCNLRADPVAVQSWW